jgi:hypothetical protein
VKIEWKYGGQKMWTGDADEQLTNLAPALADALEAALDGRSPETGRHEAYLCERRKRKEAEAQRDEALTKKVAESAQSAGLEVPMVPCEHCGEGRIPLPAHLHATWRALTEVPQTVAEIAERLRLHPSVPPPATSAVLYQLTRLQGCGLATTDKPRQRVRAKPAQTWRRA